MRRSGKTSIMHLLAERSDLYDFVCFIDKEDYSFDHVRDYHHLMKVVEELIPVAAKSVLILIDEVQEDMPKVIFHPGWNYSRYKDSFYAARALHILNILMVISFFCNYVECSRHLIYCSLR